MDTRYQDPVISTVWSRERQYTLWARIEADAATAQAQYHLIPEEPAKQIRAAMERMMYDLVNARQESLFQRFSEAEARTRHDVAAFLEVARRDYCGEAGRWLHYGLTSSDVVDTALAIRLRDSSRRIYELSQDLEAVVDDGVDAHREQPMLARTHGQPAEPITLGLRFAQWLGMLQRAVAQFDHAATMAATGKLSGPVGSYAHITPRVEWEALSSLRVGMLPGDCTQVVPRDLLAAWANAATALVSACGQIALDFRLMATRGLVREHFDQEQVGSSSMPHKRNPITAEKIGGMVRLARGYAAMLQPVELWEDRDISHSSVERVAVPDLLHATAHALESTALLLRGARWQTGLMRLGLANAGRQPYTAWYTLQQVRAGQAREQAEQAAREWTLFSDGTPPPLPLELLRNNPVLFPANAPWGAPAEPVDLSGAQLAGPDDLSIDGQASPGV